MLGRLDRKIIIMKGVTIVSFFLFITIILETSRDASALVSFSSSVFGKSKACHVPFGRQRQQDIVTAFSRQNAESFKRCNYPSLILRGKQEAESSEEESPEKDINTPIMQTLTGGPSLIFAMARRMLSWDDEFYQGTTLNDKSSSPRPVEKSVPRWHPHDGIADANPSFRSRSPAMNNQGYASLIKRNSRKRGKASLWRHSLRVYDKMKAEEAQQTYSATQRYPGTSIRRSMEHFEAALVACAKLGLWREALGIYREIVENEHKRRDLTITDNVILSLVGACVRAAKMRQKQNWSIDEQRAPLDSVRDILLDENQDIKIGSIHINRLSAAYQHIGLISESSQLIQTLLVSPSTIEEAETSPMINATDSLVKDNASYNILLQGTILEGNWTNTIDLLREMTDEGLYPNNRNINIWSETAMKRERRGSGRKTHSWKKNRERMLVRETLPPEP